MRYQLETKNNHLQVRRRKFMYNPDGSVRTSILHRHVIAPGQDYLAEPKKVRRACEKLFTAAVIKKYKADELARDPLAPPVIIPDGEIDQTEVVIMENDHVAICKCIKITEDGVTYYQHFKPIMVAPGVPVANAPTFVTEMLKAAHPRPVIDKYESEQEYDRAVEKLEQAVINKRNWVTEALRLQAEVDKEQADLDSAEDEKPGLERKLAKDKASLANAKLMKPKSDAEHILAVKEEKRLKKQRDIKRRAYEEYEAG